MRQLLRNMALLGLLLCGGSAVVSAAERGTELAVVVSSHATVRELSMEMLARIYRRKMQYWQDGSKIEPVNLPASDPLRMLFSRRVLKMEAEELEAYWNQQYFQGIFPPYMLPSEEAVMRFVADTPGAIGYVSACSVDARVVALAYLRTDEVLSHSPGNFGCSH